MRLELLGSLLVLLAVGMAGTAHADPISIMVTVGIAMGTTVVGSVTVGAIVGFTLKVAATFAIGALTQAGAKRKARKALNSVQERADGLTQNFTSSVAYVPVVYGRSKVGGNVVYLETGGSGRLYMVVIVAEGEIDAFEQVFFDGTPSTDAKYNGLFSIQYLMGTTTQTVNDTFINRAPGFNGGMQYKGFAGMVITFERNSDAFPNIPVVTAVIRGKKCLDPRNGLTAWTTNPIVCLHDYLTSTKYGASVNPSKIDSSRLIASASYCDQLVDGVKRFEFNGIVATENRIIDNIEDMTSAGNAYFYYSAGSYVVDIMRADVTQGSITEHQLLELPKVSYAGRAKRYNGVDVEFINPDADWQGDVAPLREASFLVADGNRPNIFKMQLPFTTNRKQAERLGFLAMRQSRLSRMATLVCDASAVKYTVGDIVSVSYSLMAWNAVPFRIMGVELNPAGHVVLTVCDYDADVYSDRNVTEADLQPVVGLPRPSEILPPSPVSASETLVSLGSAGIQSQVTLSWNESPSPFVSGYELQTSTDDGANWASLGIRKESPLTLTGLQEGGFLVRIKAINTLGYSSPWATSTVAVYGLTAPPANVTGASLNILGTTGILRWTLHPDLDVRAGGRIHVRVADATSGATWASSRPLEIVDGSSTQCVVPMRQGTYLLMAEDSGGRFSVQATAVVQPQPVTTLGNVLITSLEHATAFSGTVDGFVRDAGTLKTLADDGTGELFDSRAGLWDDYDKPWDGLGFVREATYTASTYIDLGTVQTTLIEALLTYTVSVTGFNWDDATGLWDDATGLWDGESRPPIDLDVWVRTTPDDPAGTPTWSDWQPFTTTVVRGRGLQFRLTQRSATGMEQASISSMLINAYTA